ncbi:hypothetical protein Tco_0828941, partial [Tanacetum coccineum]
VASDDLRDALSVIFGLSELKNELILLIGFETSILRLQALISTASFEYYYCQGKWNKLVLLALKAVRLILLGNIVYTAGYLSFTGYVHAPLEVKYFVTTASHLLLLLVYGSTAQSHFLYYASWQGKIVGILVECPWLRPLLPKLAQACQGQSLKKMMTDKYARRVRIKKIETEIES